MTSVILWLVAIFTSWFSGLTGMGGGILLLTVMTFFLPWETIIPVHGIVQLVSNSSRALFLARYVCWRFFIPFLMGAPLGGFIGYFVIKQMPYPQLPLLLICALIAYIVLKPEKMPALMLPSWGFGILGFAAGFLGLLVGATGPMLAPFFLRKDLNRQNIVATKALCQFITHIIKVPVFLMLNFNYWQYSVLIVGLCLAALLGTRLGVATLGKVSESSFRVLFKLALSAAALRLLWKVLS